MPEQCVMMCIRHFLLQKVREADCQDADSKQLGGGQHVEPVCTFGILRADSE